MTRIYWRILLTAVALVLLGGGGYIGIELYETARQRNADYQYQPADSPSLPKAVPGKPQAQKYQPNCKGPQTENDSQLCAQWASVEQAVEANRLGSLNGQITVWIVILTAFGTIALGLTLFEQRRTSRAELRAYVFPDTVVITPRTREDVEPKSDRGKPKCLIIIRNTGQTPAYKVRHWGNMDLLPVEAESSLATPHLNLSAKSSIPPGGANTKVCGLDRKLTPAEGTLIKKGALAFFIWGRIEYEDTFGRTHYSNYRMIGTGRWPLPEDANPLFCEEGNDAT